MVGLLIGRWSLVLATCSSRWAATRYVHVRSTRRLLVGSRIVAEQMRAILLPRLFWQFTTVQLPLAQRPTPFLACKVVRRAACCTAMQLWSYCQLCFFCCPTWLLFVAGREWASSGLPCVSRWVVVLSFKVCKVGGLFQGQSSEL